LPFSIYYFHQLPLYFLLSGSVVILTAHAALVFGLLHGFVALVLPMLKPVSSALLGGAVWLQNAIVYWSRKWPGAKQELDWIFPWEVALLLTAILCLAAWIRWRSFSVATGGLLLLLCVLGFRLQSSKALAEQQRTVIYQQSRSTLLDIVSGKRAVRISSSDISPRTLSFTAGNHQAARRYSVEDNWPLIIESTSRSLDGIAYQVGNWLDLPTGSVLIVNGEQMSSELGRGAPEILLLINNPRYFEVSKNINLQAVKTIILDGSNRYYIRQEWLKKQEELSGKAIALPEEGAYLVDLTEQ
jgi:competence protein ComEC